MVIYFLWGALSLCWTTDFSNTLKGISITSPLIIIPFLISQYPDFRADELKKTIKIFSLCLLAYLFLCSLNAGLLFLKDRHFSHFFYHDLVSVFDNNAIYISLAVATCILFSFNEPTKKKEDYLIMMLLGIFLLMLASKNLIATTFLLMVVSLFKNKTTLKTGAIIASVLIGVVLLIMFSENPIKARFLRELNLNFDYVLSGQDFYDYKFSGLEVRIFQWRLLGEMMANHQLGILGLGLHNVDYLLDQYFSYYNLYKGYFQINFHNQFLQTFGEIGFIGLVLLLSIFIVAIYNAVKSGNQYKILLVILFLASFFTESFLSRQKGVFLFATIYSLLLMHQKFCKEKADL
ncbi:O-antigen ligase family protein [Flavobacterium sp.]|uniref:O-antigen ligase family protein n=1 Tax=Flavobacterium sp. TaxID=239 RepID=UPI0026244C9E|nr:O-antigen ligase family protein [Flavobacterium sp.]